MNPTDAFSKLLFDDSDEKFLMTWVVVNQAIAQGDCETAHELLKRQPRFASNIFGQEAIARMAIVSGDDARAAEIYASIEAESTEARMFLARRAFNAGQWGEARRLTDSLLQQHPDSNVLRDFSRAIEEGAGRSDS